MLVFSSGRNDELVVSQPLTLPHPFIQIQDATAFIKELRLAVDCGPRAHYDGGDMRAVGTWSPVRLSLGMTYKRDTPDTEGYHRVSCA